MSEPKLTQKTTTQTEDEWDVQVLEEALKDVISSNGVIDFDVLRERGTPLTLDDLDPEGTLGDES
ncbi:MAG: hypothetical protein RLP44_06010 [Aggregatilineales bacterium]